MDKITRYIIWSPGILLQLERPELESDWRGLTTAAETKAQIGFSMSRSTVISKETDRARSGKM